MNSQLSLNLDFRPAYGREDFFVGSSNEEAILRVDAWPDWGISPFMIVYGDEGSGKKHLASVWKTRSAAVVYDAKSFDALDLHETLDASPNIILHQLHLILGDRGNEEKLFHIYNHYIGLADKRHVLMTSRFAPQGLDIVIPDLRSRLLGSPNVSIRNPDDLLLTQVLGKQLHDKGFQPSEDLLNYAVKLMERSWTAPKKLSDMINKMSLDIQKPLTKKLVREALMKIEEEGDFSKEEPSNYPFPPERKPTR